MGLFPNFVLCNEDRIIVTAPYALQIEKNVDELVLKTFTTDSRQTPLSFSPVMSKFQAQLDMRGGWPASLVSSPPALLKNLFLHPEVPSVLHQSLLHHTSMLLQHSKSKSCFNRGKLSDFYL